MMKTLEATFVYLISSIAPFASMAADVDAGRAKAEPCLACHFADDFVGESEADILELIKGTQAPDSQHPPRETELDQTDLADIAAFFAKGESSETNEPNDFNEQP